MSRIATCTNCREQVTIPEGVDQGERVRCQVCDAEYPLSQVLAEATEAEDNTEAPPELVPLATVSEEGAAVESSALEIQPSLEETAGPEISSDHVEEAAVPGSETEEPAFEVPKPAGKDDSPRIRCPVCEAEYRLSRVVVVDTGQRLGADAASAAIRAISPGQIVPPEAGTSTTDTATAPAGTPRLDVWAKADGLPHIDLGERAQTQSVTADAEAFHFDEGESLAADSPAGVAEAITRRRRKQKGVLRTLLGPVLGGIAGLVIAYYLLNWIRPEGGNFLKIPLPGVPHTYEYSPDWFPSWLQPAPDGEDALSDVNES